MKILFISHLFPNTVFPNKGIFVQRKIRAIYKSLSSESIVISPIPYAPLFLSKFSSKWAQYCNIESSSKLHDIDVIYLRYFRLPGSWFRPFEGFFIFLSIILYLRRRPNRKFDLTMGFNLNDDGAAAFFLSKILKIKAVSFAIGDDINQYPNESKLMYKITLLLLRRLDSVFAVGKGLQEKAKVVFPVIHSISHNYLGVNLTSFSPRTNKIFSNGKRRGLFVGAIAQTKGVFDLALAAGQINSDKLEIVIIGDGSESEKNQLLKIIKDFPHIIFLGRVHHSIISSEFQNADFFIFPTYTEGCACVLTEAAASGLPILTSDIIQNIDFKGEGTIFFPPKDIDMIKNAIETFLYLSNEEVDKMRTASRILAENNFCEIDCAEKLIKKLENILE